MAPQTIGFYRDLTDKYHEKWKIMHANRAAALQARRIGDALGGGDRASLLADGTDSSSVAVEMVARDGGGLVAAELAVDGAIGRLRADMERVAGMQRRIAENVFGENEAQRAAVDGRRKELRREMQRIQRAIAGLPAQAGPGNEAVAERMMRAKATALQECVQELNRQEIRDVQSRTRAAHIPGAKASAMDDIFSALTEPTPAYTAQAMATLATLAEDYEQRDAEIAAMIGEITEIQEIMRDLNTLVVEQGTMVDRIDQNIAAVAEAVEAGAEHVRRAQERSKNSFTTTCMLVLVVAIIIVFVLMVIIKG